MPKAEEPPPLLDWSPDTYAYLPISPLDLTLTPCSCVLTPLGRPLGSIGMSYYREQLFSAWPSDILSDVGAPPTQLDPAFLATLKQADWGMYGRNTRGMRRNQVEDTRATMRPSLQPPKFLSEKARESAMSSSAASAPGSKTEAARDSPTPSELESLKSEAPPMYRNLEIKYSKFGVDDFDFG
jgi:PAB-dependent poly(A)-specific ribonuclease subunit 2